MDSAGALLFDSEFLKKLEHIHLLARRMSIGNQHAERHSRQTGSSLEFADYRDYTPGDELRSIDWPAYGRFERLFVKLCEQEQDLPVSFLIDTSASMQWRSSRDIGSWTKYDQARRITAALAYITLVNLDTVGVHFISEGIHGELTVARGKSQFHRILAFLRAAPREAHGTSLTRSIRAFTQRVRRTGTVFLLSDFFDPAGYEKALGMLMHAQFEVHALQVLDQSEVTPTASGDLRLREVESGELLELTANETLLDRYRAEVATFINGLESFCRQRSISHTQVFADAPFEEVVLRTLRDGVLLK